MKRILTHVQIIVVKGLIGILYSCGTNNNLAKVPPVKRHEIINGGGYEQKGYGQPNEEDIRIFGQVMTYDNRVAAGASIYLVSQEQDTLATAKTDSEGKFDITLQTDVFHGQLIASGNVSYFAIPNLSLGVYAREFNFKIRMALEPVMDYEYMELNNKQRREIEKLHKKRKVE
ncbi:carboxypeptidase regulatory-like domain-containing protein [Sphingobacterium sp. DN00404]|uniref:Carboxypeptidase regulatory-like domain-containing protein n=1 Tax=Sphingobacterium micropteri TaxID=2763501 RepID=A0ABR7YLX6_9SPHI|nr:carboxypeptidase-like regulatory domain-containing protein [Sphingobacterium micropteri]MBD1432318.1 carboxypeptidase regulatory-like domain-containing protein [Sphingobacterium micropteri]